MPERLLPSDTCARWCRTPRHWGLHVARPSKLARKKNLTHSKHRIVTAIPAWRVAQKPPFQNALGDQIAIDDGGEDGFRRTAFDEARRQTLRRAVEKDRTATHQITGHLAGTTGHH